MACWRTKSPLGAYTITRFLVVLFLAAMMLGWLPGHCREVSNGFSACCYVVARIPNED